MIKIQITHYASRFDTNGNRYWKAEIVNNLTGKKKTFSAIHKSNTCNDVKKFFGVEWNEINEIDIEDLPIREFNQIGKNSKNPVLYPLTIEELNQTFSPLSNGD